MENLAVVVLGLDQLGHRHFRELERLVVRREQDFAQLGGAGVHVAGGEPDKGGAAVIRGARLPAGRQRAIHRHRLGPARVKELVPVGVVDADIGLLAVEPCGFDTTGLAGILGLVALARDRQPDLIERWRIGVQMRLD